MGSFVRQAFLLQTQESSCLETRGMGDIGNKLHQRVAEDSDSSQNGNVNFPRCSTVGVTYMESGSEDHGHQEGRQGGGNLSEMVVSFKECIKGDS
ncbi:hypothetical protein FH972_017546 [Carpinus fangiana]|uniref:Uncharacterized protein n=1 Tax=Carpinus fangiana TaxID=176857 RepID=A0A5N6RLC0_9ROSI|nr:hypothetical protein FH972_017546 [Carpinus fangiana]